MRKPFYLLAQREGFEPSDTFLHHTISNRARSTAPPSLHHCYYILSDKKNQLFLRRFSKVFLSHFPHPCLSKKNSFRNHSLLRSSLPCPVHFIPSIIFNQIFRTVCFPVPPKKSAAHEIFARRLLQSTAIFSLPRFNPTIQAAFSATASAARFASSFLFLK